MQFLYDKKAGENSLSIENENFRYLVKVRRFKVGDTIRLINFFDEYLYRYKILSIDRRNLELSLLEKETINKETNKKVHLLWCIIDPKVIYQTIPMLNQIGVFKISFLYCKRSQKNFKLDLSKIEKILINSCQQCGRSDLMEIEILSDLKEAIKKYKDISYLDFGGDQNIGDMDKVLVGCEGGFNDEERELLKTHTKIGLKIKNILKSETAILTLAIKSLT